MGYTMQGRGNCETVHLSEFTLLLILGITLQMGILMKRTTLILGIRHRELNLIYFRFMYRYLSGMGLRVLFVECYALYWLVPQEAPH